MKFALTNEFREDLKIAIENKDVKFIKSITFLFIY